MNDYKTRRTTKATKTKEEKKKISFASFKY